MNNLVDKIRKAKLRLFNRQNSYREQIEYFKNPPKQPVKGLNVSPLRYAEQSLNVRSQFICQLFDNLILKDSSIIELGCGIGRNLNYLCGEGYKNIYGIDVNEEAITKAPIIYPSLKEISGNLSIGSLEDSLKEFRDNQFDVTFTMCCLMHIHKEVEEEVFKAIERITKKYLITIEFEDSIHPTHFSRNYNKVFEKLGFEMLEEYNEKKVKDIFRSDVKVRILKK